MPGINPGWPISSATTTYITDSSGLALFVTVNTTPETQVGTYQVGCIAIRTDNGTQYQMTGTTASPSWTLNGTGSVGPTGATGYTGYTGRTGYTGYTGP